jgi:hypothetical protein
MGVSFGDKTKVCIITSELLKEKKNAPAPPVLRNS